jgi:serpin B
VTAPMMRQTSSLRYGQGDGWQAVELPYARDQLGMLLVVPYEGRFAQVESTLVAGGSGEGLIEQAAASLGDYQQVALALPKFTFRSRESLAAALKQLGMPTAFSDAADFSGMTTQEPLSIGDVIHEAYIAVDEAGTEAAAATAVTMVAGVSMAKPVELTIDRPFFFAVRDLATGDLLFFGRVADPTI